MLFLTEISTPLHLITQTSLDLDPLVASDFDYATKIWLNCNPSLACRPWCAAVSGNAVRIRGWRDDPPRTTERKIYLGFTEFRIGVGERITVSGQVIPLRRAKSRARDAAEMADTPAESTALYMTWLRERLVDLSPYALVDAFEIETSTHRRVLRKLDHSRASTRVAAQIIPVVSGRIEITVRDPIGVERWLRLGVGPQKAFGYGGFFPTIDIRGNYEPRV
jgi:hypothetical protein